MQQCWYGIKSHMSIYIRIVGGVGLGLGFGLERSREDQMHY